MLLDTTEMRREVIGQLITGGCYLLIFHCYCEVVLNHILSMLWALLGWVTDASRFLKRLDRAQVSAPI